MHRLLLRSVGIPVIIDVLLVEANSAVLLIWYDHRVVVIVINTIRVDCHSSLLTGILGLIAHFL